MRYAGTWFRSTLEADWACTFDFLKWHWEYEPGAVRVGGVNYLPDFRLPGQGVWVEVKGPNNVRVEKPRALHAAVAETGDSAGELMVLCRPAVRGAAAWECATGSHDLRIAHCGTCNQWCFVKPQRSASGGIKHDWRCRHCQSTSLIPEMSYWPSVRLAQIQREFNDIDPSVDWVAHWFPEHGGRLPFQRAPRHVGRGRAH
jgi:hypothetical protein